MRLMLRTSPPTAYTAKRSMVASVRASSCLSGINLTSHEHNNSKTYLRMMNVMKVDRFAFTVTLVNDVESKVINAGPKLSKVGRLMVTPSRNKIVDRTWLCFSANAATPSFCSDRSTNLVASGSPYHFPVSYRGVFCRATIDALSPVWVLTWCGLV